MMRFLAASVAHIVCVARNILRNKNYWANEIDACWSDFLSRSALGAMDVTIRDGCMGHRNPDARCSDQYVYHESHFATLAE